MTTTPIDRSTSCRAWTQFAIATSADVPTTTDMNPWPGGDVQGSGFGSMHATKRIAPGRLDGMT